MSSICIRRRQAPRRLTQLATIACTIVLLATATGCTNFRYGWNQEKQALVGWQNSVKASLQLVNEPDHPGCAWAYGWKKECHQAPSLSDWTRGWREDRKIFLAE